MNRFRILMQGALAFGCAVALMAARSRAEGDEGGLLARLPSSKHTLSEALEGVAADGSVPISAKLEFEAGKLWLSAYGAKAGLDKCAEKNAITKALANQPGQVYSVEPGIRERSPIFHVAIATAGGGHVNIDVESGT